MNSLFFKNIGRYIYYKARSKGLAFFADQINYITAFNFSMTSMANIKVNGTFDQFNL